MIIPPYQIKEWKGLNTTVKDNRFLDKGETYDSLNWITSRDGDNIQLRRGQQVLGLTDRDPEPNKNRVTGLGIGTRIDGVQIPFFSAGRSIYYYDLDSDDTVQTNTINILPENAENEDTFFNPYTNLAGSFIYEGSPHSSTFKIPVANPGDPVDQRVLDYRFGFSKINRSRTYGMARQGDLSTSFDATGVYLSWIDKQTYADYPAQQVNLPQASGDNITTHFSGSSIVGAQSQSGGIITYFSVMFMAPIQTGSAVTTITKASDAIITVSPAHGLVYGDLVMVLGGDMPQIIGIPLQVIAVNTNDITVAIDSTSFTTYTTGATLYKLELFNDDRSGNLNSNLGGTGTINYSTGAWDITFNTPPVTGSNNLIANVNYEDATVEGILDFSFNTTSRVSGTGNIYRQDDGGGKGMAIWPFQGVEYCFHKIKSWVLNALDTTDTLTTNLPYYEQIGIPYPRAVFPTGDGVIFLNNVNPSDPKVSILRIPPGTTNLTVLPITMSAALDLSGFSYDYCVIRRWGNYDIMGCQNITNGQVDSYNSVTFIKNIYSGVWNRLDYRFTCLDEYYGALIGGDSISPNLSVFFSGFDDDGEVIQNHWKSSYKNLDMAGLKKVNYLNVQGLIQADQELEVYISLDQGAYVKKFSIQGNGAYVAINSPTGVGSFTSGTTVVGGSTGEVFARPFEVDIPIHTDRFEYISFMLKAVDVGYVQVDSVAYKDIRFKRRRLQFYNDPEIDN